MRVMQNERDNCIIIRFTTILRQTVQITPDMYRKYIMNDKVSGYGRPLLIYAGDIITLYSKLGLRACIYY